MSLDDLGNLVRRLLQNRDLIKLEELLKANPDIAHLKLNNGNTLLHEIVCNARLNPECLIKYEVRDFIKALLQYGVGVNALNDEGKTAPHCAVEESLEYFISEYVISILLSRRHADVTLKDRIGRTPVDVVFDKGKLDLVIKLAVEGGAAKVLSNRPSRASLSLLPHGGEGWGGAG